MCAGGNILIYRSSPALNLIRCGSFRARCELVIICSIFNSRIEHSLKLKLNLKSVRDLIRLREYAVVESES